ncbi:hypothetical protein PSENEW3_20000066 (mitochondrion) [Picochlorum sp. SENEW3]|nr:hypothetical protein PSENEW3_20000066 [Picochlorum sp. SENEW3]
MLVPKYTEITHQQLSEQTKNLVGTNRIGQYQVVEANLQEKKSRIDYSSPSYWRILLRKKEQIPYLNIPHYILLLILLQLLEDQRVHDLFPQDMK